VIGFLLDTNVLSELVRPKPDPHVVRWLEAADEEALFLSVLTLGELRKGIASLADASRKALLESWVAGDIMIRFEGRILEVDRAISERWGQAAGMLAKRGTPLPVIDGLLAATALHHGLTLVTRNIRDVAPTGVMVIDPWTA